MEVGGQREQVTEAPALESTARLWLAERGLHALITQEAKFRFWACLVLIKKEVVVS